MENAIKICIDTIFWKKATSSLLITGWAFDEVEKSAVSLSFEGILDACIVNSHKIDRPDVKTLFEIAESELVGFQVELSLDQKVKIANLVFKSNHSVMKETIDLTKKYPSLPGTETKFEINAARFTKGLKYLKKHGIKRAVHRFKVERSKTAANYQTWINNNENKDSSEILKDIEAFEYKPLISVVMPVYNVEEIWLRQCINSVQNQYYTNWELCIADDASTDDHVRPLLEEFAAKDNRIKLTFRKENGHISEATNSAIAIANGEFVALLDNDDELSDNALYEVVKVLNIEKDLDLIYSDEDKIDMEGNRSDPAFKGSWSPDLLLGTNYISHLGVYRKSLLNEIGGFRKGYEGSQDYDLVLRFTEKTTEARIKHIPKILYHWRMLPTSTAVDQSSKGYAFEAGLNSLQDALKRREINGYATHGAANGLYDVYYDVEQEDLVSIIIPTKNGYEDVKRCVNSIIEKTSYPNYEIIIADNGSTDQKMPELYASFEALIGKRFRVVPIDIPFNFSEINNIAVKEAKGKYLLFLNNDTEVITGEWLKLMISFGQLERVGCVGAKLLYPNNTIQHAGVILGLGGVAGHGHYGYPNGDLGHFGKLALNVDYSAVTAACLLVKKVDFDLVKGFDEEFTVAFNDVDFCLKIKALGRDNVWLHEAELYHFESQTRGYDDKGQKKKRFAKEKEMMENKWGPLIENDPYYNPNLTRKIPNYSCRD